MGRGKLILIEGLDRTGKSTQCERLRTRITNSELIKFPDRSTPIGQLINRYLTESDFKLPDQSIHLLFSANRWELNQDIINKLIEEGKTVILDRYIYSGIAYSAAKGIDGMDLNWCSDCDRGLVSPDLTIFLANKHSNESRDGFGEERYENNSFQERVRTKFYELFETLDKNNNEVVTLEVTDKTIEQVHDDIWTIVKPTLETEIANDIATLHFFT